MKKLLSLMLAAIVLITAVPMAYAEEEQKASFESFYIKTVVDTLADNYKFGITDGEIYKEIMDYVLALHPELLEGMLDVAASTMDEHTYYMPADTLEGFYEQTDNSYVGIGVTVERTKDSILISEVKKGGPADKVGIKANDLLIRVNDEEVSALDVQSVSEKVKGPKGSYVYITVLRDGEEITFSVKRETVKVSTVSYEIDDENQIGYIYISRFGDDTDAGTTEALMSFKYANIKNVIVDVRDNPGGELPAVLNTLSSFVPKDKLMVKIVDKKGRETEYRSISKSRRLNFNVVVLANENSASAAELFAGAIRDNKAGTVIGTKTYGKGTVQSMLNLKDTPDVNLGDIKLTTAEYFLPCGDQVNKKGVEPNIEIENEKILIDDGTFLEFIFAPRYELGDTGEGVLALEQRLEALGLQKSKADDVFDKETFNAVMIFQKLSGLYPYGVMDITTQNYLVNTFSEATKEVDKQMEAAIDFFKKAK